MIAIIICFSRTVKHSIWGLAGTGYTPRPVTTQRLRPVQLIRRLTGKILLPSCPINSASSARLLSQFLRIVCSSFLFSFLFSQVNLWVSHDVNPAVYYCGLADTVTAYHNFLLTRLSTNWFSLTNEWISNQMNTFLLELHNVKFHFLVQFVHYTLHQSTQAIEYLCLPPLLL